ncbi:MAG: HAD hydrolase-like protein [Lachnospiraceae bacterium]|nr:HAD hydrolase-like protein [Lachnospiraceae bacterium]
MFEKEKKIKADALLLDVDGTLWNSTGIVAAAWTRAAKETGYDSLTVRPEMLKELFGKTMDDIARALVPEASDEERDRLMERCELYEQEALENDPCDICYPGVIDTIKRLSEKISLCIVSNCQSGYIELFMSKTGLTKNEICDKECFGDTGEGKAANIRRVVERNGFKNVYYVGDIEGDRVSAREAGVGFISAEYGFGDPAEADVRIDRFDRLAELIL